MITLGGSLEHHFGGAALDRVRHWAAFVRTTERIAMWILVQVVKGSKHFEAESRVANHVLICDTSDMVISARSNGDSAYRFEARKGNENFVIADFNGAEVKASLVDKFFELAKSMGAISAMPAPAH